MKRFLALFLALLTACFVFTGCQKEQNTVKFYMPDGAGALAVAKLIATAPEIAGKKVSYNVVTANTIGSKVMANNAELALMPLNTAVKLYNSGSGYILLSVNTHGNLYIVGDAPAGLDALKGSVTAVIGQGGVPDLVLRMILMQSGAEYQIGQNAKAETVTIRHVADGAAATALLSAGSVSYALMGEPAATNAINKLSLAEAMDVQSLFEPIFGSYGFPQAALVVKESFAQSNRDFINAMCQILQDTDWIADNIQAASQAVFNSLEAGAVSTIGTLTRRSVERCNIKFMSAQQAKQTVKKFIGFTLDLNEELNIDISGGIPDDGFFYS